MCVGRHLGRGLLLVTVLSVRAGETDVSWDHE